MNNSGKEIVEVYLEDILPNRFQPRLIFDQTSLNELAESIKQHGVIQPLVLRRLGDKYEIIAGERRYKASQIAGLKTVPAIIMNLDDNKSAEIAIVENIQRKEMTPLEEAKSFKKLLDRKYLTQEQLAVRMGKSQSSIANKLRLLNLDEEVQDALLKEKISERHARSLLAIKENMEQKQVLKEILDKKLTVKQTDDLIKERYGTNVETDTPPSSNEPVKTILDQSTPKPFIPNPYKDSNSNPQIALINKLNEVDSSNIQNDVPRRDPIPFNYAAQNQNESNVMDLDINKIKEEAQDIIKPQAQNVDINNLLKVDTPNSEEKIERPKNKFIMDFDDTEILDFDDITIKDDQKKDPLISQPQPETQQDKKDVKTAVELIKNDINTLKESGLNIEFEEFDFEKLYQLIIRIDK